MTESLKQIYQVCEVMENRNKARDIFESALKSEGYHYHHTSIFYGYYSRKSKWGVESYSGRFGVGVIIHVCRFDSTRSHFGAYWVKD